MVLGNATGESMATLGKSGIAKDTKSKNAPKHLLSLFASRLAEARAPAGAESKAAAMRAAAAGRSTRARVK